MQRYMYIEKEGRTPGDLDVHGIFVPIDSPIEFTMDKLEDKVCIRLIMGKYECSKYMDKPANVHIEDHYEWCKEGTVDIITWFLSTDIKVFDCTLFFASFVWAKPLEDFKDYHKNKL